MPNDPRRRRRCLAPALLTSLVMLLGAGPAHAQPTLSSALQARADAERLVAQLWSAEDVDDAAGAIRAILERAGIGVYDAIGTPLAVGNERSEHGLWLLDAEVEALAIAFLEESFVPLGALAHDLRQSGVHGAERGAPAPITAGAIERGLRSVRAEVEATPLHEQAFTILLVDMLGDRETFPFALLEDDEAELGVAAPGGDAMAAMMRAMVEEQLREALGDDDAETAEMLERLLDADMMDAVVEAMMRGDIGEMMRLMMTAEELAEMDEVRRELREDLRDRDLDPETRELLESTDRALGAMFTPGDHGALAAMQRNLDTLRVGRDAQRRGLIDGISEWEADLADAVGLRDDAVGRYRALASVASTAAVLAWLVDEHQAFDSFVREHEAVVEEAVRDHEEALARSRTLALPWEDDDGSELMLDPLQLVLVTVDLLFEPREHRTAGAGAEPRLPAGGTASAARRPTDFETGDFLALRSDLDACAAIGRLEAANPDAFGALQTTLDVGRASRDAIKLHATQGIKGSLIAIARSTLAIATTQLDVRVEYLPDDVEGPVGGIHLAHHRDDERRVLLHVSLRDLLPEVLSDRLRDALRQVGESVEVCGFMKGFARDVGGAAEFLVDALETAERLADGRDLEGLPVLVDLGGEAWRVLRVRPRDWDAMRGPSHTTMIQRTDADGTAIGVLYPQVEDPDLGGWREIVPAPVRVQAILTESDKLPWHPAHLGLRVGEEVWRPVERWVQVNVERHIALPIRGSFRVTRTVTERSSTQHRSERDRASKERHGSYTLELQVRNATVASGPGAPDATLPAGGAGAGLPAGAGLGGGPVAVGGGDTSLSVRLSGGHGATSIEDRLVECDEAPTWLRSTTDEVGDFSFSTTDASSPPPSIEVVSRTDRYALHPQAVIMAAGAALALMPAGSFGTRDVTVTTELCDGSETDEHSEALRFPDGDIAQLLLAPVQVPQREFLPFDRSARMLDGSITWTERIPMDATRELLEAAGRAPPEVTYQVTTTVEWRLEREP